MKRKVLSLVLTLAFCLGLAIPAMAAETMVTSEEELRAALTNGGNIVLGSDIGTQNDLVIVTNTNLDLNGHKLTIICNAFGHRHGGIVINLGQTLTISDSKYSKTRANNGKLYVNVEFGTGIQTSGATLIINSGVVEAIGGKGTGIGGANKSGYKDGGTVIVNGGTVTATGGYPGTYGGAGIGGMGESGNGGTITINGGTVTATGGRYGAGIGGGGSVGNFEVGGASGTITINGGTVRVNSNSNGYSNNTAADVGQGSGTSASDGTVKINGGTVELLSSGIRTKTVSFKNCTITGEGAGKHKGSYDTSGNLVVVNGASEMFREGLAGAIAKGLVPADLQSDYTQPITRAQFCALAVAFYENMTGQEITERKTFSDTSDVNVEKMGALEVVSGTNGNLFNPNGTLTRQQAATILARLAAAVGEPLPEVNTAFADHNQISAAAIAAVGQVQGAGIMGGVGNNMFDPWGLFTRQQSIITILRLYNLVQ